jgi:hypothetical protein
MRVPLSLFTSIADELKVPFDRMLEDILLRGVEDDMAGVAINTSGDKLSHEVFSFLVDLLGIGVGDERRSIK